MYELCHTFEGFVSCHNIKTQLVPRCVQIRRQQDKESRKTRCLQFWRKVRALPRVSSQNSTTTYSWMKREPTEHLHRSERELYECIRGDSSWVWRYVLETKQKTSQWKPEWSPRPLKARQGGSAWRRCSLLSWTVDVWCIVRCGGQTVNQQIYLTVFRCLREVGKETTETWGGDTAGRSLHHSTSARTTLNGQKFSRETKLHWDVRSSGILRSVKL